MSRRLKSLVGLITDQADRGELAYIALEHLAGGTGALEPGIELPSRRGSESGVSAVQPGDVLFGKLRPYLAKTLLIREPAYASIELMALRPSSALEARYLAYLVGSRPLIEWATASSDGTKMPRTSWEKLGEFRVSAVPSLADQRVIADYLDRETVRIDALIEKRQAMIQLVTERLSTSIRSELVSSGWQVVPLKRNWQVIDCKHRTPTYKKSGFPVISPGDATPGRLDLSRAHRFVDEDDFRDLAGVPRNPKRGDIIYSRNASIGIASFVDTDEKFCMGQDVCLITSSKSSQLYLLYVLNTIGVDQLDEQKIGSTFNRVNIAQIHELKVPTPSVDIQEVVGKRFDKLTKDSDNIISVLARQVDLLMERRRALITAAVTGELEIPEVAA